uniref:Uncharacterized protein n=1 Tax=Brassica oleracea TaxID=3712 RepID=A0A3P6AEZ7_BRAOL|nr:unnamed protein product [Brassica oleracea]
MARYVLPFVEILINLLLSHILMLLLIICSPFKGCCFVQKLVPCCSTTFAFITSVLLAMSWELQ